MINYKDAFINVPLQEKIATLFYSPLNLFEFVFLYIKANIKAKKGLEWSATKRVNYKKTYDINKSENLN